MVLLSQAMKEKEFDVRMVGRSIGKGLIFAGQLQKYESSLSDDSDYADFVNLDQVLEAVRGKSGLRNVETH